MARGVGTHAGGSYDSLEQQDIIDCDCLEGPIVTLTGTADVLNPHKSGNYVVTTGSADLTTLGAPTVGTDDGLSISFSSTTAFAHKITATGLLQTGTASVNSVALAAFAGANVQLRAFNGFWQIMGSNGTLTLA